MTLAQIAEQWIQKLIEGAIRYDPHLVRARPLDDLAEHPGQFTVILNENRKARFVPATS